VDWIGSIWSLIAVVVGLRWVMRGKVDIGIEGRVPTFVIVGNKAIALGLIAILSGIGLFFSLVVR
jgi:hypothetical protein